ncbi:rolling circle replication-associated protein [Collimonas antrihumi]|uniref:rolling circle replication-associated protein n=1 Tax=Collimonas antrihumi TaxID=1940615 RepID=UPI001FEC7074|nr:hypothetical protein [Collimonas antrihumi]
MNSNYTDSSASQDVSVDSNNEVSFDLQHKADKPEWWSDDGHGWQDTYIATKRVFPDGQVEVMVRKEKFFVGAALVAVPRSKRGESENRLANDDDAGRRAKKRVRQCCKALGADRLVTLTYRENMVDRERALADWKKFTRRLNKAKAFKYVAVIEEQKRGALHFHVAVAGRQNYYLLRSIWQSVVGLGQYGEQMGQVNVRDPHRFGFGRNGLHKLASYIAKYCSKQMDCRGLNQKRYLCSRGIDIPESDSWRIASTTMLGAVQTAFAIIGDYNFDGLQTWVNNGLGVVWLASCPIAGRSAGGVFDVPF